MAKKITKCELQKRINEIKLDYPEIIIDLSTYSGFDKKIKVIDKDYGEWWTSLKNLYFRHVKHPKRRINEQIIRQTTSIDYVKNTLYNVWGNLITIYENSYINCITIAKFNHKKYGDFFLTPNKVMAGHLPRKLAAIEYGKTIRKYDIDYISKKLYDIYGDEVVLDVEKFEYGKKAWFIHKKYGNWYASINNVLRGHSHPLAGKEKMKISSIKKYGVEYPTQNIEIQKKIIRNSWKTLILYHWKTNEELLVRASFEWAVVSYLNDNKIDFKWQIPFYLDINNKNTLYVCDLYLPSIDKFIEIKGIFKSEINKLKWETFHKRYKNSEIWFEKDIENFIGKTRYIFSKEYKKVIKNNERKDII